MLTGKPSDLLVIVADTHCNDAVGLCPTEFKRANRDVHLPSVGQRFLWRAWLDIWSTVAERKRETGAEVSVVWAGDAGDLNSHSRAEIISPVKKNVQDAMRSAAEPALEVADRSFVCRGTTAHVGELAELEEQFAADIGAEPCVDAGTIAWPVLPLELGGVRFEIAHRPPCSSKKPDGRNQAAARSAGQMAIRSLKQRLRPADVYVWGHVHYSAFGSEMGCWGFQCPPMKLVGAYGYAIGVGTIVEPVGVLLFEIAAGDWRHEFLRYTPRRIKPWTKS